MASKVIICLICSSGLLSASLYAAETAPSLEFLEYLAEVETSDGTWLDPLDMKEIAQNEKSDTTERENRHD